MLSPLLSLFVLPYLSPICKPTRQRAWSGLTHKEKGCQFHCYPSLLLVLIKRNWKSACTNFDEVLQTRLINLYCTKACKRYSQVIPVGTKDAIILVYSLSIFKCLLESRNMKMMIKLY